MGGGGGVGGGVTTEEQTRAGRGGGHHRQLWGAETAPCPKSTAGNRIYVCVEQRFRK